MEVGEVGLLFLLSLFFLSPGVRNLWTKERTSLFPGPCCHVLCDAVMHAGCRSLCSTCYTSLCTLSPTVDSSLVPNAHDLQDLDPSVHRVLALEEVAFGHLGYGSESHQGSETEF